jgi:FeS assembly SUF system protein
MFWGRRKHERDDEEDVHVSSEERAQPAQRAEETPAADAPAESGAGVDAGRIRDRIIAVLKTVYDPEIPVDIYELGLVYGVDVGDDGDVHVTMTLTSPMCPVAETLPPEVEDKVRNVLGVKDVKLDLVWDPPWSMDMMSDAARLELNLM